jgi:hypothetical protein
MQLLMCKRQLKTHIARAVLFYDPVTNKAANLVVICKHETLIIMSTARLRTSAFPVVH